MNELEFEKMKQALVEKYAAMGPAQIIEELLAHEGAEGFSYGLADRAQEVADELRAAEPPLRAFSGLCSEIDMQGNLVPPTDLRPENCRNRQYDEGRPYPKGHCQRCGAQSRGSCLYV